MIGQPHVGVAHHAENMLDSPLHHGLRHRVGHRVRVFGLGLQANENIVAFDANGVELLAAVFMAAR